MLCAICCFINSIRTHSIVIVSFCICKEYEIIFYNAVESVVVFFNIFSLSGYGKFHVSSHRESSFI